MSPQRAVRSWSSVDARATGGFVAGAARSKLRGVIHRAGDDLGAGRMEHGPGKFAGPVAVFGRATEHGAFERRADDDGIRTGEDRIVVSVSQHVHITILALEGDEVGCIGRRTRRVMQRAQFHAKGRNPPAAGRINAERNVAVLVEAAWFGKGRRRGKDFTLVRYGVAIHVRDIASGDVAGIKDGVRITIRSEDLEGERLLPSLPDPQARERVPALNAVPGPATTTPCPPRSSA